MNRPLTLTIARLITIAAFMVTLSATYYLRSEVLTLNKIRLSADNVRAKETLREMTESHPVRLAEYGVKMQHYDLQMNHYSQMLELYRAGRLPVDKLITRSYELEELSSAFADMEAGTIARSVIAFD